MHSPDLQIDFGTLPEIDELQVHGVLETRRFLASWSGDIWSVRVEPLSVPRKPSVRWSVDLLLSAPNAMGARLLLVLGVLVEHQGVITFPHALSEVPRHRLGSLADAILHHVESMPPNGATFSSELSTTALSRLTKGRAIPGLCPMITAVNHIRRYRFARTRLNEGPTLDCACGAGYGAAILTSERIGAYLGLDTDADIVAFANRLASGEQVRFANQTLEREPVQRFKNVVSLETLEHVSDPYAFIQLLIANLDPEGQLILSVPAEEWAGSHRNSDHITNWNYARFERFANRHFAYAEIYKQQLSYIQSDSFSHSEIFDRPANSQIDETFIAILKQPRTRSIPRRIVVRRLHAMGDVVWTTPLVRALHRQDPEACLVVETRHTQAYISNPDPEIVTVPGFPLGPQDVLVDLDGAYERRRGLHIVEAYFAQANVPLGDPHPTLYPDLAHFVNAGTAMARQWKTAPVKHVVALHPAATSPDRIWPLQHWQELISTLAASGEVGLILVGGYSDFAAELLGVEHDPSVISFVCKADLLTTSAALSFVDLLIAPDSGVAHIAASVRTRSIVLFGMADPATRLARDGSATGVWSTVGCRGCLTWMPAEAIPMCPLGKSVCMEAIGVDRIASIAKEVLAEIEPHTWRRRIRAIGVTVEGPPAATESSNSAQPRETPSGSRLPKWRRRAR